MALFVLSLCPFDIFVGVWASVIGLNQISSFFILSWQQNCTMLLGFASGFVKWLHCTKEWPFRLLTQTWGVITSCTVSVLYKIISGQRHYPSKMFMHGIYTLFQKGYEIKHQSFNSTTNHSFCRIAEQDRVMKHYQQKADDLLRGREEQRMEKEKLRQRYAIT